MLLCLPIVQIIYKKSLRKTKNDDQSRNTRQLHQPNILSQKIANISINFTKLLISYIQNRSMFPNSSKQAVAMNLPVNNHVEKLSDMVSSIKTEADSIQKELQILRGNITQLSYINKESDRELNAFLVDSIAGLRNKWGSEWEQGLEQLQEHKKKLAKLGQQHEDVEINREELQERSIILEEAVGLFRAG